MQRSFVFWLVLYFFIIMSFLFSVLSLPKDIYMSHLSLRLRGVMNSASDAAISIMQEQLSVNPEGTVELNPDEIWSTYKKIFMSSFDLVGDVDELYFEDHTPVAIILSDNGFYVKGPATGRMESNGTGNGLFNYISPNDDAKAYENFKYDWSPLIPFTRDIRGETFTNVTLTSETGATLTRDITIPEDLEYPILVMDSISGENIYLFDYNDPKLRVGTPTVDDDGNIVDVTAQKNFIVKPISVSKANGYKRVYTIGGMNYTANIDVHSTSKISEMILSNVQYCLNRYRPEGDKNSLAIPTQLYDDLYATLSSFKGLSIMVMAQDFNPYRVDGGVGVSNYSIAASQLVYSKDIYCYELNGEKLFSFGKPDKGDIKNIVATPVDAVKLGYSYDYRIGG